MDRDDSQTVGCTLIVGVSQIASSLQGTLCILLSERDRKRVSSVTELVERPGSKASAVASVESGISAIEQELGMDTRRVRTYKVSLSVHADCAQR